MATISAPSATASTAPLPTKTPKNTKATLLLKKATDIYRQCLAEAHGCMSAGNTENLDTFWLMTNTVHGHGSFNSTARRAYADATELYGEALTPAALESWDAFTDTDGPLVTYASPWRERRSEAGHQSSPECAGTG